MHNLTASSVPARSAALCTPPHLPSQPRHETSRCSPTCRTERVIVVGGVGTRQGIVERVYHDHAAYEAALEARLVELEADRRELDGLIVAGSYIVYGPLELDLLADRAWLAGRRLPLAPCEWTLLVALARRSGQVVPRDDLLTLIADRNRVNCGRHRSDPSPYPMLRASVSRLRSRLGAYGALIESQPGDGYRLRALPPEA